MKLSNALIVFDVESTGIWIEKDKIIEIALVKLTPDGKKEIYHKRINPGILIPPMITKLTGISNEDVAKAPTFKEVAKAILMFIGEADLAGFGVERFDLPLLEREFADAGITFIWKTKRIYDAQRVFHLNEKRDLSAAYKFYCGDDLEGAHSALVDTEATLAIFEEQVKRYGEGDENVSVLDKFQYAVNADYYDKERKFCWWNGKLYLMFGKHARKTPLEDLVRIDKGYLTWVTTSDFSDNVKSVIKKALQGEFPTHAAAVTTELK